MFGFKVNARAATIAAAIFSMVDPIATEARAEEWMLGHILPPDHPGNRALEAAAVEIAERTEGRVEILVFPAGQIGGAKEVLTGLTIGTHHMAFDGAGLLSHWTPEIGALEAPYLARDFAHLERIIASEKGQELIEKLRADHGLHVLDIWYYGERHMTNDVHPINAPADVAELKMRVPEIEVSLRFIEALGGRPTPMAFPELYLGLQTGVVDGQENPLTTIVAAQLSEVQRHLALTGHLEQFVAPIVSESAWSAISEQDRATVLEVLQTRGDAYNRAAIEFEDELLAELEKEGIIVTHPDRDAFAAAAKPIFADFDDEWGVGTYEALAAVQ